MFAFFNAHSESFFWVAAQLALGVIGTALWPRINEFLRQDVDEQVPAEQSWQALNALLHGGDDL